MGGGKRGLGPLGRVLLVIGLSIPVLPLGMPEARAEGGLEIEAKSTYTIDPEAGFLDVAIDYTLTNTTPNTTDGYVTTRYYFNRYGLVIPDEATNLEARNQYGTLRITDEIQELADGSEGRVAIIHFGSIFYRQTTSFTFSFSLPGGEPRSEAGTRVNPAYTAFWVQAFGDPDKSEVEIHLPTDFEVTTYGSFIERTDTDDAIVFAEDNIPNPSEWGVFISGRRDDALQSETVGLGDLDVEVRAWPGDAEWAQRVVAVVAEGMPELQALVGLEYHIESLVFLETLDPSLVGYAGWYLVGEDRIEMGEHLDDHVILHELAHLWFNQHLFIDRWISEGLADTFAAQAVLAIDGDSDPDYATALIPVPSLSIAVPLNDWDLPRSSSAGNDEVRRREEYGYNASFFVVKALYDEIGAEGLSKVLNAAVNDHVAYQGPGEPEIVDSTDSWRRFLDLLEEVAGSEEAEGLFRTYVVASRDMHRLDDRAEARTAYHAHVDSAAPWDPPWALREPLSEWDFPDALGSVAEADAVLQVRGELVALALDLGLEVPTSLELAYESAMQIADLTAAEALGSQQLAALQQVALARAAVDESRGFFDRIGLIGENPEREWSDAANRFEADDIAGTHAEAQEALALMANAGEVGQERVMWAGAGLVGAAGVGVGGVWLIRRIRRGRAGAALVVDNAEPGGEEPPG